METIAQKSVPVNNTKVRSKEMTPEEIADSIKTIAKNIRDSSARMRETVRVLRQSGAIDEITDAVRLAVVASRDTAVEINETARQLRERGVIKETAAAVEDITNSTRDTVKTIKESAKEVKQTAPHTYEVLGQLSSEVKKAAGKKVKM